MSPFLLALFAGPLLALSMTMLLRFQFEWEANAAITLGVTLLCVVWWIFEPIPIPASSPVPWRCCRDWVSSPKTMRSSSMAICLPSLCWAGFCGQPPWPAAVPIGVCLGMVCLTGLTGGSLVA